MDNKIDIYYFVSKFWDLKNYVFDGYNSFIGKRTARKFQRWYDLINKSDKFRVVFEYSHYNKYNNVIFAGLEKYRIFKIHFDCAEKSEWIYFKIERGQLKKYVLHDKCKIVQRVEGSISDSDISKAIFKRIEEQLSISFNIQRVCDSFQQSTESLLELQFLISGFIIAFRSADNLISNYKIFKIT